MDRRDPNSIQSNLRNYMTPEPEDDRVCELPGCQKKKYREKDGTVYPFCGRSHGRLAKQNMQFEMTPGPEDDGVCELPGCQKKKYREKDGTLHPFCGRSHGKLAKQNNQSEALATRKRPPSSSSPLTTKMAPPVVRGGKSAPGIVEQDRTGAPGPSASFPSTSRYQQIERFLNSRDVVDLFEYCNLKNDAILGELRTNGIINREQRQMMSESVPVTANKIVHDALLGDPSEKKLKTFGEILKKSESDANQKLADKIATFLQLDTEIRPPDDVHYIIMTANKNEWKSAQYFLGVDCDVSEKVKGQTFQDDEDLAPKMKGINPEISMGGTTYQFFTVNQKAAVLMKCSDMGSFSHQGSLHEASKLLNKGWPLKAIFIVGYCSAMAKAEDQIGSVFVGDRIYYYGSGKITEGGMFKIHSDPHRLDSLGCETLEGKGSPRIKNIKKVSMLSGDFVMKDEHAVDERCTCLEENQVGFDMEGIGVVMAVNIRKVQNPSEIPPKIVLLKGVSDHADAMKNVDHNSFMFFSEEIPNVDEDTRQQMCTIMSLTVALRAICNGFLD